MTKHRSESGFTHSPEPRQGADAKTTMHGDGSVTVSFSDGSEDLKMSRRGFMRLGGVAAATAAMAGAACRNPVEHIVPYVDRPEEIRIGHPNMYATVCADTPGQYGMLVQTRAGRPIKLEGNPNHPASQGALDARAQASYLNLYDPDRARGPLGIVQQGNHREIDWAELDLAVATALEGARAGGIALLTSTVSGSGRRALIEEIRGAVPGLKHYTYEPINSEALLKASELSYGKAHVPHYRFDRANYIVSLGSDFLGTWLSPVEFTKQFASRRDPAGEMNRLVQFEGNVSVTGMNADDRIRVRPSDLPYVAMALANVVIGARGTGNLGGAASGAVSRFTPAAVAAVTGVDAEILTQVGNELAENAGKSLVVAGGMASAIAGGVELELAVNLLNAALGNEGVTVLRGRTSRQQQGSLGDLTRLIADIEAGKIDVLIIDEANPVYDAPPSLDIAAAIQKVKFVVSTSDRVDETSLFADYLAPHGHYLESWGDSVPFDGVYAIQQPVILPLWDTRALEESLIRWFGANLVPGLKAYTAEVERPANVPPVVPVDPGAWYRYLRKHWEEEIYPLADAAASFDQFWNDVLKAGAFVQPETSWPEPRLRSSALAGGLAADLPTPREIALGDLKAKELQLWASVPLYDGRHANNGHLQELPDPVSKHSWGSYVQVSPKTFNALGLEQGQMLKITVNGRDRVFPVLLQPGLHDDVLAIPVGYGRERAGVVGNEVGENAFAFSSAIDGRQIYAGLTIEDIDVLDEVEPLAKQQGGEVIDLHRRGLFASTTLAAFREDPGAGKHEHPPLHDMYAPHDYGKLKWGMAIDMTRCTGCNACVVACQEENNIPVVGKEGVLEGREMYWLRIDRYYELPHEAAELQHSLTGDPMYAYDPVVGFSEYLDNPRIYNQPMLCQHCENAPCETVCPVSATMHSADGLNQMAYNRCVGTRYCANNCPYKVRRFNWFNYTEDRSDSVVARLYPTLKEHGRLNIAEPLPMQYNPDVTVRTRGVMEKCTFCVHRIRRAQWQLKEEGRLDFRDGEVIPACAQTCPADAIVFGNLSDENSVVAQAHRQPRAAFTLKEIGVEPSIAYLSSVWNTTREEAPAHHGAADGHDAAPAGAENH